MSDEYGADLAWNNIPSKLFLEDILFYFHWGGILMDFDKPYLLGMMAGM